MCALSERLLTRQVYVMCFLHQRTDLETRVILGLSKEELDRIKKVIDPLRKEVIET